MRQIIGPILLIAATLALPACTTTGGPATATAEKTALSPTETSAYRTCMREAEWPAYNSVAYKRWNARQRESMDPRDDADVAHMQATCHSLFFDSHPDTAALWQSCQDGVSQTVSQFGAAADDHAKRMLAVCRAATNGSV